MMLDLTAFSKAIAQLEEALEFTESELAASNPRLWRQLRAAAIQAFEFTYELACKTLRRFLINMEFSSESIEMLDFSGLIRAGYARGLLSEEIVVWREFHKNRGTTSHTYDSDKAQEVFEQIPRFLREAKFLRDHIVAQQFGDT